MTTWYDRAMAHITKEASNYITDDIEDLERFIRRECYPFGKREMWPYKSWCTAVNDYMKAERKRRGGIIDDYSALPLFGDSND